MYGSTTRTCRQEHIVLPKPKSFAKPVLPKPKSLAKPNQQREFIVTQRMYHEHHNKYPSRLRQLLPGMQVNTRSINSTTGTSSNLNYNKAARHKQPQGMLQQSIKSWPPHSQVYTSFLNVQSIKKNNLKKICCSTVTLDHNPEPSFIVPDAV